MNNANFFSWIRAGVKHSVIQGVGDAIEQLGAPDDQGNASPQVLAFLRSDSAVARRMEASDTVTTTATNNVNRARRRLGKSLKEIDGTPT
jgi:hypothetical protein